MRRAGFGRPEQRHIPARAGLGGERESDGAGGTRIETVGLRVEGEFGSGGELGGERREVGFGTDNAVGVRRCGGGGKWSGLGVLCGALRGAVGFRHRGGCRASYRRGDGAEPAQERAEFVLAAEGLHRGLVGRLDPQIVERLGDRGIAPDFGKPARQAGALGVVADALAELALDVARVGDDLLQGTIFGEEFRGGLLADTGDAGDVVGGVAGEA